MTFWLTLGQAHTHRHNGITLDCDGIYEFESLNYSHARLAVGRNFGNKWSNLHDTHPRSSVQFYPRGIIKIECK